MSIAGRVIIDGVMLGTINLDPRDDGMTDEDLKPDGPVLKRYNAVAKPLTAESKLNTLPSMSTLEEALAVGILLTVIGSVIWIPVLSILAAITLSWTNLVLLGALVTMLTAIASALLPDEQWPPYRFPSSIRLLLYKYFGFKLVFSEYKSYLNTDGILV